MVDVGAPVETLEPESVDDAMASLATCARRDLSLLFSGGGTEAAFGYPTERVDCIVSTARLTRTVEYAPADMVIEVEAGMTLAALAAILRPHGQRLALDVPQPERATVGGVLASARFGPLRTRYGTPRDLIVGVTLVRADGARVRGGGKVVKNVAGFDLPKLAVGSFGTLALIATATLRLHPLPEARALVRTPDCGAPDVEALLRALVDAQLEPGAFVAVSSGDGPYECMALFEGFTSGVDEQVARFEALAHRRGRDASPGDASALAHADEAARSRGDVRVRLSFPPASLLRVETVALAPLRRTLPDARTIVYPALGIAFASGTVDEHVAFVRVLDAARAGLEAAGGNCVLIDAPVGIRNAIDVFGTLPPSFPLMAALKSRFDPSRRLARGRFLGRL